MDDAAAPYRLCQRRISLLDVHVGARLRQRREQLNVPLQPLADIAGVSLQQVRHYESAASRIPPSRLCLFARSLGVPVAWFFDDLPPAATGRTEMPVPERQLESRETASLVEAYYRIANPTGRRAVYRLIQSMASIPPA